MTLALVANAHAQQRAPVDVVIEPVRETTFMDRIEALGTLQANELVEIGALITERIDKLYFEDGDVVEEGALLVQFEMNQEIALLAEAEAVLENATLELERVDDLIKRGVATATELSQRQREFAVAKARLRAVRAQSDDRSIRAPFAGTIGIRDISVGATVSPGCLGIATTRPGIGARRRVILCVAASVARSGSAGVNSRCPW